MKRAVLSGDKTRSAERQSTRDLKDTSSSIYIESGMKFERGALIVEILKLFNTCYDFFNTDSKAVMVKWARMSRTFMHM